MSAALFAGVSWQGTGRAASPDAVYTTTVQLRDGKTLTCDVNPPGGVQPAPASLTQTEQREAEVIATYRLRLLSGPRSDYPTDYTAPHVVCRP
ncbi:hypothetical protein AWB75_05135 [Caballeronia catudaia]|uniref:Uncharacterized protein n=1 Tax=Caballeronia catudaia TaxID=1777136 RepID=A0A158CH89_9BURK|nr:hypothetical protein AWB75_05135 [Caballeronia catudaia]